MNPSRAQRCKDDDPRFRDAETANIPFLAPLTGALRRCYSLVWPSHTALATPSTASRQHHQKWNIDNFRIPNATGRQGREGASGQLNPSQKTGLIVHCAARPGRAATYSRTGDCHEYQRASASHAKRTRLHTRGPRRRLPSHLFTPRCARAVLAHAGWPPPIALLQRDQATARKLGQTLNRARYARLGMAFAVPSPIAHRAHFTSKECFMNPSFLPLADIANPTLTQALRHKLDNKTKPLGSLGRLEELGLKLGQILGSETPALAQPQMVVFAGDHGLTARGVSAFPSDVTWQMVENFLAGGAAVSVLARQHGLALTVVDCGVKHDFLAGLPAGATRAGLQVRKAAGAEHGTADSSVQPAMTPAQCQQALANGQDLVKGLPGNALLLGEMGIGNTSAASLLLARLAGLDIAQCTGAGTGLDAPAVQRKTAVLREVLQRHANATAPLEALAALGGFEIATMVGAVLQAAHECRVVVVDGFIATSAVLVAHALQPLVLQRCVFAHRSGERGHEFMLQHLGVQALLDLGLRLGEGSGGALAWPLLQSACAILREMASFESAGVSEKSASDAVPQ